MSHYIRSKTPGATYFFTARLADRSSTLLTDEIDLLRSVTRRTRDRYPFRIDAIVILPSAIHTIWTLPEDDADFSTRWSFLKGAFSRALPDPFHRSPQQQARREKGIWQRRFWEHRIRSPQDFALHCKLIHSAPVHAGLVRSSADWVWTSLHRDLAVARKTAHPTRPKPFSDMNLKTLRPVT